ncbi:DUF1998 domain-containing protein [Sphingopyxis sp. XHP0097]|uniref:DUF1998 domain-containing protein n=1 Tax=Sphingopyxis jiangsuensis TaxID=2871171 RepID=A0ABS7MH56_9SPHN|nr:DUF1998 domain-containing protein [Sphingopyxis jiangsuensis]MBY4638362.1 DUF1998 domain-containing protein [Sphingopyxis jiangsuensis]
MSRTRVGEIRPSQLLWTYGPGALIDLPNMSVITQGIDKWDKDRCEQILESRLLSAVRKVLGPQIETLNKPPMTDEEATSPMSAAALVGVPVKPFPRWLRCVKCGLLSPYDSGLFTLKKSPYRPEATRFVHGQCRGSKGDLPPKDADAVPARFLLACRAGHLDDFPWHWFVHGGQSNCAGNLRFFESGASLQTENLWVRCDTCNSARNMAQASGVNGREKLPACRGRHPHLDRFDEECDETPRAINLGATNGWFAVSLSVLAIPLKGNSLSQLVQDGWKSFEKCKSLEMLEIIVDTLKSTNSLPGIENYELEKIWSAIEVYRSGEDTEDQADLKAPEWEVLTADELPADYPHFMGKVVGIPSGFQEVMERVVLLERLREVNALLGFTRVEAPEEGAGDEAAPRAPLGLVKPDWTPAFEVHGEGIFIRFDAKKLEEWAALDPVKALEDKLRKGHRGWRFKRNLDPEEGYLGIRHAMLHTLAHFLIRELALECGYNAASIRERIYADTEEGRDQAGILIYTAAADSDGTLGGLVDLGKPNNLGRILKQALRRAQVCASDPLCSEHDPSKDQSLHGASCHACSFVSETSCECGNRNLDRALVIPTLQNGDAAFFKELV